MDKSLYKFMLAGFSESMLTKVLPEEMMAKLAAGTAKSRIVGIFHYGNELEDLVIVSLVKLFNSKYEMVADAKSHQIGYFKPTTKFQDLDVSEIYVGIFQQVDLVPPMQQPAMRAIISSMMSSNIPVIVSATDEERASKALGIVYDMIRSKGIWFKLPASKAVTQAVDL